MSLPHPYACRMCGATSYRRVIDRDGTGALRPTSLFHCSGCSVVFMDPKAWRDGEGEPAPSMVPPNVRPLTLLPSTSLAGQVTAAAAGLRQ